MDELIIRRELDRAIAVFQSRTVSAILLKPSDNMQKLADLGQGWDADNMNEHPKQGA